MSIDDQRTVDLRGVTVSLSCPMSEPVPTFPSGHPEFTISGEQEALIMLAVDVRDRLAQGGELPLVDLSRWELGRGLVRSVDIRVGHACIQGVLLRDQSTPLPGTTKARHTWTDPEDEISYTVTPESVRALSSGLISDTYQKLAAPLAREVLQLAGENEGIRDENKVLREMLAVMSRKLRRIIFALEGRALPEDAEK